MNRSTNGIAMALFLVGLFALSGCVPPVVAAAETTFPVRGRVVLPPQLGRPEPMKVVLNQGEHTVFTRFDGSFKFHDVSPGIYVVSVLDTRHHFGDIKVDVKSSGKVRALLYAYPGAPKAATAYPLVFRLKADYQYFVARPQLSVLSIFKHPMILMMVPMMLMMVCLPKMMENMDPEEREKMQKQMKHEDPREMLNKLWGNNANDSDSD